MGNPLVSVIMPVYQQEPYVAEALRSILVQTYRPLEIIVSDDRSSDRTFDIAGGVLSEYRGPHRVTLDRNERNLGIENYNFLMSKAAGAFIVLAHGDDAAYPNRVARLVERWQRTNASLVASNAMVVDAEGRKRHLLFERDAVPDPSLLELARRGRSTGVAGATFGYGREVFDTFGPLDRTRSLIRTDFVLPFRAALLKGIALVGEPLLRCRQHESPAYRITRGDLVALPWEEARRAEIAIQTCYQLDTLLQGRSLGLQPSEMQAALDFLLGRLAANVREWAIARNRLPVEGWRPEWTRRGSEPEDADEEPPGQAASPAPVS